MDNLVGQNILITGGTGSLGKALTRKIIKSSVKKIIIYSRSEFLQHEMKQEFKDERLRFLIGDIRDKERLKTAMKNVDIVIHTAALKQVPTIEYNPFEAVKTNILGAQNIIECAIENKVNKIVALSTDKASSPINLYGATKLISDKLFQSANVYSKNHNIKMSVVRYGNVAGSRGSVIPFFRKMLDFGDEILPITHDKMTRFWISLDEAVDLVLLAIKETIGGEIFVSKIPSFKIVDLVKAMGKDYEVIGIREGEKIHEELISQYESIIEFDNYYKIIPEYRWLDKSKFTLIDSEGQFNFHAKIKNYPGGFNSGNNRWFLTVDEIKERVKAL